MSVPCENGCGNQTNNRSHICTACDVERHNAQFCKELDERFKGNGPELLTEEEILEPEFEEENTETKSTHKGKYPCPHCQELIGCSSKTCKHCGKSVKTHNPGAAKDTSAVAKRLAGELKDKDVDTTGKENRAGQSPPPQPEKQVSAVVSVEDLRRLRDRYLAKSVALGEILEELGYGL